jgi:glycosyltransferase involved in cell wall biosynthesis
MNQHADPPTLLCIYPWLTMGGADKFNLDMLSQLRARGWRTLVATTLANNHPWRPQFEQVCDTIIDIGALPPETQASALLELIAEWRPGWVLISNSNRGYRLLPALRAQHPNAAYLDYNHAIDPDDPRGGYPAESIALAGNLDLQLVSSHPLRDWMIERGGNPQRIRVCTTNIDTDDWNPDRFDRTRLRADLGIAPTAVVGIFPARLEHVKRPPLAIALMRAAVRSAPDTHFLIAGDGTYAGFLRSYIRAHGLGQHIHMLGSVSNQRMRELLAISDLLLLPSQMEGLSLAIYEAMAMGVVPISVAAGGQAELVTAECGILVPRSPHEQQEYTQALVALARNRPQLAAMGRAAQERVRSQFRLEQMGERVQALLLEARDMQQQQPQPISSAEVVQHSIEQAMASAIRDAHWAQQTNVSANTMRRRLRNIYWWLVERGAWWLVPLTERLRFGKN